LREYKFISLITFVESRKTKLRQVRQVLQRLHERNKGHLKLMERGSPKPKNKQT
jgi:hypothetical protein